MMKIMLSLTYDGAESRIKDSEVMKSLFHTEKLPGHSVIARGMEKMPLDYIRRVIRRITARFRRSGLSAAVDSSGFSLSSRSSWFDIRIRRVSTRREHMKLHIVIDVENLIILHFTITGWNGSDIGEFKRLIGTLPRLEKVCADAAYCSRENHRVVAAKGGTPHLAFKSNATLKSKGCPAWHCSLKSYLDDRESWLEEYSIRSVVESVFSSIKRCLGSRISSRKGWHKRRELGLKVLAYDLKRALYIEESEELGESLWVPC